MNTLIANPKAQYLLGAGLDVLHFESREWLDTLDFYTDEVRFFENLLNKKEASKNNNPEYEKMLKDLDKIHKDLFDDLKESIIKHEQLLSRIELAEKGLSDNDYREKHQHIYNKMNTFSNDFKTFKKIVFDYSKRLKL
ncbi:hypothetical protein DFQ10_105251 [Winogradskyella eximia]|uniref:Uncharacterized protein n=1 Tax=Winogradskyella eximia TaxID=262006 RepID=A0A3D9H394_9FLAO|nr:hypothetical protein [Winogradskyella eximia]RED43651.1 hypothetical protein DFQ10_105251 [Winogradskyella eximia]|tara:strand:+ start:16557 stop:16970 length:414 start_codon:yes stop_codon:yes gene_type:complete